MGKLTYKQVCIKNTLDLKAILINLSYIDVFYRKMYSVQQTMYNNVQLM